MSANNNGVPTGWSLVRVELALIHQKSGVPQGTLFEPTAGVLEPPEGVLEPLPGGWIWANIDDALGNTLALSDSTRTKQQIYAYEPYDEALSPVWQ